MWVFRRISAAFAARTDPLAALVRQPGAGRSEETPPAGLRRTAGGSGAGLTGGSGRFPPPGKGGKVPVQPHPERGGKCQFSPTRKGGESASFDAGGDQPPLATSGRCCLAAARLCVSPSAPAAVADGGREIPEAGKAVVRQKHRFQPVTVEKFHRELSLPIGFGDPLRSAAVEMRSEIRVEADYVERQDGRGNKFAHACPRCASRLRRTGERSPQRWRIARPGPVAPFVGDPVPRCVFCKRPLSRIGDQQEGLFGEPERTRWRRECARRGPGDRRRKRRRLPKSRMIPLD